MVSPLLQQSKHAQEIAAEAILRAIQDHLSEDLRKDLIGWKLWQQISCDLIQALHND